MLYIRIVGIKNYTPLNLKNAKPVNIGNMIENLNNFGYATYDNDSIYYVSTDEKGISNLYKSDFQGENKKILRNGIFTHLNIINGWIYCVNFSDGKIYKINTDGEQAQKMNDKSTSFLLAYDNKLYFIGDWNESRNNLFSMNLDGTDLITLSDEKVSKIYIYNNAIYMASSPNINEKGSFSKIELGKNNKEQIFNYGYGIDWFCVYNDYIYYVEGRELCKVDIWGNGQSRIAQFGEVIANTYNIDTFNGNFYYSTLENWPTGLFGWHVVLHRFNLDTEKLYSQNMPNLNMKSKALTVFNYIVGDKIFISENGKLFVTDLDGKNGKPWGE
jgi:hypothetical protein